MRTEQNTHAAIKLKKTPNQPQAKLLNFSTSTTFPAGDLSFLYWEPPSPLCVKLRIWTHWFGAKALSDPFKLRSNFVFSACGRSPTSSSLT